LCRGIFGLFLVCDLLAWEDYRLLCLLQSTGWYEISENRPQNAFSDRIPAITMAKKGHYAQAETDIAFIP